jgi:hypothetical protein
MGIDISFSGASFDWSALLSNGIGAIAALAGVALTAHFAKNDARAARRAIVVGGVKALWAEMTVNFTRYEAMLAEAVRTLETDHYLTVNWPIQSDYFSVYAANAGLLGELGDDRLAADIIEAVTAAKGLIDSLRLNLEMVQNLEVMRGRANAGEGGLDLEAQIEAQEAHLVTYAVGIKSIDARLTAAMRTMAPRIAALE